MWQEGLSDVIRKMPFPFGISLFVTLLKCYSPFSSTRLIEREGESGKEERLDNDHQGV